MKQLDNELNQLLQDWQQTLLDNFDDPIVKENFDLLKSPARRLVDDFVSSKTIPVPVTTDFVTAVQEVLSDLEKINVTSGDIKQALLLGGSPATLDDIHKRFDTFLEAYCKGKDTTKLRFVVE